MGPIPHLFCVENIDRRGSNWPLGTKMCNCYPEIWIFWAKSQFFILEPRFSSTGHNTSTPWATNLPSDPTLKKFHFQAMGHFPELIPDFGHFGPKVPLILNCRQETWWDRPV